MDISEKAYSHIKKIVKNKELYKYFTSDKKYKPYERPVTFFMAGSPGAGKTEFSKNFLKNAYEEIGMPIVRIDADEIRDLCPGYNGKNSHLFQHAVSFGVSQLYYYVLKEKYNALLDSTFSNINHAESNIRLALNKNREVDIMYIFQDPIRAWEFTLKREKIENRKITLDVFIHDFFKAMGNVNKVKQIFKNKINVDLIKKNYSNDIKIYKMNIKTIDRYIKINYTKKSLYDILKNVKI